MEPGEVRHPVPHPESKGLPAAESRWLEWSGARAQQSMGPAAPTCQAARPPCTSLSACPPLPADDLASRANILIDPLELQAATMDDLDEAEESAPAAAQVPR